MSCYVHGDCETVALCTECQRELCAECASKISPPLCAECARIRAHSVKGEMFKNIAIGVVLMILGMLITKSAGGVLLAGIPYGWLILNRLTPNMFIWMSWIGWIVYFLIKLVLAYVIGVPALVIKLVCWFRDLARVNAVLKCIGEGE